MTKQTIGIIVGRRAAPFCLVRFSQYLRPKIQRQGVRCTVPFYPVLSSWVAKAVAICGLDSIAAPFYLAGHVQVAFAYPGAS
jgi:hypothetical protein